MKRALLVGINYEGTSALLRGCLNDVYNIEKFLREQHSFDEIKLVLERDATTAGIKAGLNWLVTDVKPGDTLFFHYSGHGSQIPSAREPDGYEEIICPIDLNWRDRVIRDQDLKTIFNRVPVGANTTILLDCCHSGDGINHEHSFIPSLTRFIDINEEEPELENRFLPPPAGLVDGCTHTVEWTASRDINLTSLLIATAASDQTAADAFIDGQFQGAGTFALLKAARANPEITYKELVEKMSEFMIQNRFTQRPQLDGFFGFHYNQFLESLNLEDVEEAVEHVEPAAALDLGAGPRPTDTLEEEEAQKDRILGIAGVVVVVLILIFYASVKF
jgi:hypothetical protein